MKNKGLSFDDFWEEYFHGTNTTYIFNKEKNHFQVTRIDIIVGSFYIEKEISREDLKSILLQSASLNELREQGFDL